MYTNRGCNSGENIFHIRKKSIFNDWSVSENQFNYSSTILIWIRCHHQNKVFYDNDGWLKLFVLRWLSVVIYRMSVYLSNITHLRMSSHRAFMIYKYTYHRCEKKMLWNGVRNNSDPNKYGQTMYYCRRLHNLKRPKKYEQTMYYCRRLHILSGKYVEIPWRYTSNKQKCKAKVRTDFTHSCEAFDNNTLFAHICLGLNYFELHFTTFFSM
jgi:hypothetical protein